MGAIWLACRDRTEGAAREASDAVVPPAQDLSEEPAQTTEEGSGAREELAAADVPLEPAAAVTLHPSYELKVVVLDTNAAPVCNAEVSFRLKTPGATPEGKEQLVQPLPKTTIEGVSTKSIGQERLLKGLPQALEAGVTLAPEEEAPLADGLARLELLVAKPHYVTERRVLELDLRKPAHEVRVTLDRGLGVFGTVRHVDGTPVTDVLGGCGIYNVTTNELGELTSRTRGCDGRMETAAGILGFQPDAKAGLRIWSKTPGFEEYDEPVEFAGSDVVLDIVLRPTSRVLLTLRDCATGEPLSPGKFSTMEQREPIDSMHVGRGYLVESRTCEGPLERFLFHLKHPDTRSLVVYTDDYLPQSLPLPTNAARDAEPLQLDACLMRLKALSLEGVIESTGPDGQATHAAAARFRITVTLSLAKGEPYSVTTDIPAGVPFKATSMFQLAMAEKGPAQRGVTGVDLTQVECIAPDLRSAELTDADGKILAPASASAQHASPLLSPISLLATGTGPDAEIARVRVRLRSSAN